MQPFPAGARLTAVSPHPFPDTVGDDILFDSFLPPHIRMHPLFRLALLLAAAAATAPLAAAAQDAPETPAAALAPHADAPAAQAMRTSEPIRVDGILDEEAWGRATPVTEFTQMVPDEGRPASERTEVRILFDSDALYVGARMYDSQRPTTRLGRRDAGLPTDWLTVIFDSYHDHRTAFGFEVNPSGVRRDQSRSNGEDPSWDPVWEVATTVDDEGWTAEMRIPFSQLRFNPAAEQTWGLQLERTLARRGEFAVMSFTPSTHPGGVQRFAHLHGLRDLRTGRRAEILPYVVARGESVDRSGNPFRDDRSGTASVGVDVKYRLTSDLTLDATLNPDFGQVEVDPASVNLTAIETFFQERRPFFVEGSEIFNFGSGGGNNAFYSRRIGRAPQLGQNAPGDVRDAARILGAVKLSGRTAGGWSVGFLDAVTERVEGRYLTAGSDTLTTTAEPFTNYMVARLRRDSHAGQRVVGGMFTAVNRDLDSDAARGVLHSAAYTGGTDFRLQWGERAWTLAGFVSGSYVRGSEQAILRTQRFPWRYFQRPDADHLSVDSAATSLAGLSTEVSLAYRYGRHWRFNMLGGTTTPGYEVGDIGFQYRADRIDHQVGATYVETRPSAHVRQWQVGASVRNEFNYAGNPVQRSLFVNSYAQAKNFWTYQANFGATAPTLDDRLTRGGPIARRPLNWRVFASLGTDERKPVTLWLGAYSQQNQPRGYGRDFWGQVGWKPAPNLSFELGPSYSRSHSRAQYLGSVGDPAATETFGRRYLFAELRQTVVSLNTRMDLIFRPGLTLQVYAQPFVAAGSFGEAEELAAPRTYEFVPSQVNVGNPDFNIRSLRGSAVARWEWRPGSTLYVAWQQLRSGREGIGDFRFGRDSRALFDAQPDNVLMVKINYWLNP
jgi:hypothetical protein